MKYLVPLVMGAALAAADIVPPYALSEADVMGKTLTFTDGSSLTFYRSMTAKRVDPTNGTSYGTWSIENGSMVVDQQVDIGGGLYMTMAGSAYMDAAPAAGVVDRYFANGKRDDAVIDSIVDNGVPTILPVAYGDIAAYDINVTEPGGDTITLNFHEDMTLIRDTNGTEDGYGTWSIDDGVVTMTIKGADGVEVLTAMFDQLPADDVNVTITNATGDGGAPDSFSSTITYRANSDTSLMPTYDPIESGLAGNFINFSNLGGSGNDCNVSFFSNMALKQVCNDSSVSYGSWSTEPVAPGQAFLRIDVTNNSGAVPFIESTSILLTQPLADGGTYYSRSTDDNITEFSGNASAFAPLTEDYIIKVDNDFNGDGKVDLVWRNGVTGQDIVWYMNDDGTRQGYDHYPIVTDTTWDIKTSGDFDGDGKPDLVWRNGVTGQNIVWYMNDDGTRKGYDHYPIVTDTNWDIKASGDFDGDGQADLIWRNSSTGKNIVWYMNNDGTRKGYDEYPTVTDLNWDIVSH